MNRVKKIGVLLLTAFIVVTSNANVAFAAQTESYVTGDDNSRQSVPECYIVTNVINNIGEYEFPELEGKKAPSIYFKNPQDLFIDDYDNIYIVDTGNNRIVKMDSNFKTVGVFFGPDKDFNSPEGIFVDKDEDMFLADTENHRIVHLDAKGGFVEEFTNPETNLGTGNTFTPTKLIVSQTGLMYAVKGENIMKIDGNGEFRGFFGQTNIGFDFSEWLFRLFASEQQKAFHIKRLAASYINLTYGEDGMIYATSMEREEGEIKKLNSMDTNIYRKYKTIGNSLRNPVEDFIKNKLFKATVAGQTFRFGEYFNDDGMYIEPEFADICVDKNGILTVVERLNGKVYQYDQAGRMLVAFGGLGEKKGTFTKPSAIDVDSKGRLYILDQISNNIQVFEPTEFIGYIHEATMAYNDGDYVKSFDLWNKVLKVDENYSLAHVGLANAYYKQEKYVDAMREAKIVKDRDIYSVAFDEYKYEVLRNYFFPIVLLGLAIIIGLVFFFKWFSRHSKRCYWNFIGDKSKKMGFFAGIEYAFFTMLHPIDSYEGIKNNRERLNWFVPIFIFAFAYVVRMGYLLVVHFPLASIEIEDINPWFEMMKLWIVPLSWIPASFMATSISGGESKVKEITFASAISLTPYIAINVPLMFISNLMSKTQKSWYGIFSALAYIGMFLMFFIAMKILNRYSFWKTVGMMLVSGFLMLVLWLVLLLCYVLAGRTIQFIISLFAEFKLNFL